MAWIKKGSKTDYLDIVKKVARPYLFLRHDLDYDLDHALRFAEYEASNGISSTYFLLPTAPYFDYSFDFKIKVRALEQMGHELGLHNNFYYSYLIEKWDLQTLSDEVNRPLDFLRDIWCDVELTSCHGQREHYDAGVFNYQIWREFDIKKNEGFPDIKPILSLKDFGLKEVYFEYYTHYWSDSGNGWTGIVVDGQKPFERSARNSPENIGHDVIEAFNESKIQHASLQILTHPCHYEEIK